MCVLFFAIEFPIGNVRRLRHPLVKDLNYDHCPTWDLNLSSMCMTSWLPLPTQSSHNVSSVSCSPQLDCIPLPRKTMHSLSGIWLTSAQNFRQMDPEILPRMMWQAFEHWTTNYDNNVNYVLEELIKQVIEITTAARYLKERSMNQTCDPLVLWTAAKFVCFSMPLMLQRSSLCCFRRVSIGCLLQLSIFLRTSFVMTESLTTRLAVCGPKSGRS